MKFNILTIFPDMFPGTLSGGVVGRALESGIWSLNVVNLRDFAMDARGSVDDEQFGGGAGMVMIADVIARAIDSLENPGEIIYFSPRGETLNQKLVRDFVEKSPNNAEKTITLLCGRYEGVDQRVIDMYNMREISIGDYILSGGEVAAQVFIDSCVRIMDNVVHGGNDTTENESFEIGGLEWPLYTRPSTWRGQDVPEVLLSGHHGKIDAWRREQSRIITQQRRPELLKDGENEEKPSERKSK